MTDSFKFLFCIERPFMIYYHLVHPTISHSIDRSIMQHARQWKDFSNFESNRIPKQNASRVLCGWTNRTIQVSLRRSERFTAAEQAEWKNKAIFRCEFSDEKKQQKREKNRLHGAKATLLSECFGESSCLWTLNRLRHSSKYRSLHMRSAPE